MPTKGTPSDPADSTPGVLLVEDEATPAPRSAEWCGARLPGPHGAKRREALRYLEQHPGEIRLVLSDIIMPYMDGGELAERARDLLPGLRFVLMSSSLEGMAGEVVSAYPETPVLRKPFSFADLYTVVVGEIGPPLSKGRLRPSRPALHRDREPSN
jgi:CheY-like chemotaxis protein